MKTLPDKSSLRSGPKTNLEFALLADSLPASKIYEALATLEGVD